MTTLQPNGLEGQARAYDTRIIVNMRDYRQQGLRERLHEEKRERKGLGALRG